MWKICLELFFLGKSIGFRTSFCIFSPWSNTNLDELPSSVPRGRSQRQVWWGPDRFKLWPGGVRGLAKGWFVKIETGEGKHDMVLMDIIWLICFWYAFDGQKKWFTLVYHPSPIGKPEKKTMLVPWTRVCTLSWQVLRPQASSQAPRALISWGLNLVLDMFGSVTFY